MRARRGLTLLEVLLATMLLTLITAVCVPLFRDAMEVLHATRAAGERHHDQIDLGEMAERVLADPAAFGVDSLGAGGAVTLAWADESPDPPVLVQRVSECWLRFSCDDLVLHRWMKPEDDPAEGGP